MMTNTGKWNNAVKSRYVVKKHLVIANTLKLSFFELKTFPAVIIVKTISTMELVFY